MAHWTQVYVLMSVLQKEIRRGNEREAIYWAFEMVEKGFFGHLISRLRVIAHEDIGVADVTVLPFVSQCLEDAKTWYKDEKDSWVLAVTNSVIALCRANKSSDADNLQIVVRSQRRKGVKLTIPDYAYDMHTDEGKNKKGRGYKHFFDEAAKVIPDKSKADYATEARQVCIDLEKEEVDVKEYFEIIYPERKKKKDVFERKVEEVILGNL